MLQRRDWAAVICLVTGLCIIAVASHGFRQAWLAHREAEQSLHRQRSDLSGLQQEQSLRAEYAPRYRLLQRQGLIGGRLLTWIEVLEQSRQEIPLLGLRYNLSPAAVADPQTKPGILQAYFSDIELELKLRHEDDLQRLFQRLRDSNAGHFQVRYCELERLPAPATPDARAAFEHPDLPGHSDGPGSFGLRSRCELRWHTLSAEPADWMHT